MSRVTRGLATTPTNDSIGKYHKLQLTSISQLLASFISNKQKNNQKYFMQKVKALRQVKVKSEKMMLAILKGLFSRKSTNYLKLGFRKLWENVAVQRKAEQKTL